MGSSSVVAYVNVVGLGTIALLPHSDVGKRTGCFSGNWISEDDPAIQAISLLLSKHSSDPSGAMEIRLDVRVEKASGVG
jgi:hypothetical protein